VATHKESESESEKEVKWSSDEQSWLSEQSERFIKKDEGDEGKEAKQRPLHTIHVNQGPTHATELREETR